MFRPTFLFALFGILLIPAAALAEQPLVPSHLERRFRAHDLDENDLIDRSEIRIEDSQFSAMDRNGDHALSRAEIRAEYERRMERARQKRLQKRGRSSPAA